MWKANGLAMGALVATLASCVLEDDLRGLGTHELVVCPNFACAQNGPDLTSFPFHELSERGEPNAEGYTLGKLWRRHRAYTLEVHGWELRAVAGEEVLAGADLVGARFDVTHAPSGRVVRIRIRDRSLTEIFAGPRAGTRVPQYFLEWAELGEGRRPTYESLCLDPQRPERGAAPRGEPTLFFEGNRYDRARKLVLAGDSSWFNVACKSHVMAKLLLTGQTTLSGGAQGPSLPEQQAVLKALVADYCGDGHAFTVGGEPLLWKTADGAVSFAYAPSSLEARWGPRGPLCLGEPRLLFSEHSNAHERFPDEPDGTPGILAAIAERCPERALPRCDGSSFDFAGAHVVTANP